MANHYRKHKTYGELSVEQAVNVQAEYKDDSDPWRFEYTVNADTGEVISRQPLTEAEIDTALTLAKAGATA